MDLISCLFLTECSFEDDEKQSKSQQEHEVILKANAGNGTDVAAKTVDDRGE